jgi:thiol:disulfide interchange protein
MPPPAASPAPGTAPGRIPQARLRSGSTRHDPFVLLVIAVLLLALRVAFGIQEARLAPAAVKPGAPMDRMHWRAPEAGLAEARATGKPLLYDFTADWCPPCRLMQREIFADPQAAAELNRRFVPVQVLDRTREEGRNAAWVDSLQTHFHVSAFPTLVIMRADGGTPVPIEGYLGRDFTLDRIEQVRVRLRMQTMIPLPSRAR